MGVLTSIGWCSRLKKDPNSDKEALHGLPYKPLPLITDDKLTTDNSSSSGYVTEEDNPSDEEYDAEYDTYQSTTSTMLTELFLLLLLTKAHHVRLCTLHLDSDTLSTAEYMSVEYVSAIEYAVIVGWFIVLTMCLTKLAD
jgi:hypothetical protein